MPIGQPRTDLFGMGKGEAQVFDTSPLVDQSNIAVERSRQEARIKAADESKKRAAQEKVNQKNQDQMMSDIAESQAYIFKAGDKEKITGDTAALVDMAKNFSGQDGVISTDELMEFNAAFAKLKAYATSSKMQKEQLDKLIVGYNSATDRVETLESIKELRMAEGRHGEILQHEQNVSFDDSLSDARKRAKEMRKTEGVTLSQANDMIEELMLRNPQDIEQAVYDMRKDPNFQGEQPITPEDAIIYRQEQYAAELAGKKPVSASDSRAYGAAKAKQPTVTNTTYDDGTGKLQIEAGTDVADRMVATIGGDKVALEDLDYKTDKDGKKVITGGMGSKVLTPDEKSTNSGIRADNIKREKSYDLAIDQWLDENEDISTTDAHEPKKETWKESKWVYGSPNNFKEAHDKWKKDKKEWEAKVTAQKKKLQSMNQYKLKPLEYSEKPIELSAKQVQDISHGKFKVKAIDVLEGKGRGGINYQEIKGEKETAVSDPVGLF